MTSEAGRAVAKYFKNDAEGNAANCEITALDSTEQHCFQSGRHEHRAARCAQSDRRPDRRRGVDLPSASGRENQEPGRQTSGGIAVSSLPIRTTILGVDFGRARIGMAVSDELGLLAHPVETIPATRRTPLERIAEIVREKECGKSGDRIASPHEWQHGRSGRRSARLRREIAEAASCEVVTWDERLTTIAANRALREGGRKTRDFAERRRSGRGADDPARISRRIAKRAGSRSGARVLPSD